MAGAPRPPKKKAAADAAAEPRGPLPSEELRRQAEERLDGPSAAASAAPAPEELAAAVHELRVHQIELEMQNEELRRAQHEADALRVKYAELFHLAPVGYFTLSEKGIVGEANLTAAGLVGMERRRLVGQPFVAFILAADRDTYYRHLELLKHGEEPQSCQVRIQPVGDEPFWAQLEGQPQGAAGEESRRYHLTFTDVHKRVLAEKALRRREEQLARAVEGSGVGLWDWQVQSGEETFNERWAEILGYTLAELAPTSIETWRSLTHPDDLRRSDELLETHFRGESEAYECEARMRHKDGHWVWVLDRGKVAEWDGDARPLRMIGTDLDITERKQAEDELRESEEKHRTILETAMDGFWLMNAEGRLLDVNEAYCQMSGYSVRELLGMAVGDLETAETAAATAAHIAKIRAHGEDRFESRHRRKDGTVFDVEVSVRYMPGGDESLTVFVRDITERKQAESYREMGREVLQILNEPADLHDSIRAVLAAMKTRTGLDAVGIRLQDGEDFPYYTQEGFSAGFLRTESPLLERGADGEVRRDVEGRARLECTCGLVLSGKTDASSPLFTPGGSFWTNDSFPLLDLPPDQDPRLNPRNQCMHHGYAAMALVPIRSGDGIVGLIHLDDRRKGRFTKEAVELLEAIAAHLGKALLRRQAEAALRRRPPQRRRSQMPPVG